MKKQGDLKKQRNEEMKKTTKRRLEETRRNVI